MGSVLQHFVIFQHKFPLLGPGGAVRPGAQIVDHYVVRIVCCSLAVTLGCA